MIKISEFKHLNELDEIYDSADYSYPISNPNFLSEWKKFIYPNKLLMATVLDEGRIVGYCPILENRSDFLFRVFKPRTIFLPMILSHKIEPESYRELFHEFLKSDSQKSFAMYHFNFLDPFKEVERELLSDNTIKVEFVTHASEVNGFRLHKKIRQRVKKAKEYGLWIDGEITNGSVEQYLRCRNETLDRKRSAGDYQSLKPEKHLSFYQTLDESNVGKFLLTRDDENNVLGGGFIIHNKNAAIPLYSATCNKGLQKYAGYFFRYNIIQFCKERKIKYFDSYGCYKNSPNVDYQNMYMFKSKWGEEIDVSQYVKCPNIVKKPVSKYLSNRAHVELPSTKSSQGG